MENHASNLLKKCGEGILDESISDETIIPVYQIVHIFMLNTLLRLVCVNVLHSIVQVVG